jgi:hypothetical protein
MEYEDKLLLNIMYEYEDNLLRYFERDMVNSKN